MKRRLIALLMALTLPLSSAWAEITTMREDSVDGLTVLRNHLQEQTDAQQIAVDYPTFECTDAELSAFLEENITQPIRALSTRETPAEGQDVIRGGYNASLDFDGLLSVEASVRTLSAGAEEEEIILFSAIVDLNAKRLVALETLFNEPDVVVDEVICNAVYEKASGTGSLLPPITDSGLVPLPDSYYLTSSALRVTYAPGTLCDQAAVLDLPWEELPITFSSRMQAQSELPPETIGVIGGADGPTSIWVLEATPDVPQPTPTPLTTVTPFPVETLDPNFELPPVITPTPMPVAGNDAIKVDVLTHGLWKPLGGEGDTYYQFTEDGKLLTVKVSSYTVEDGVLTSDVLNGVLDIGSDSAFTLDTDGKLSGYVLNRQGDRVAPEEFVTPSPTPVPTPTPSPTPVPTPTPSPTSTPSPTPTPVPTPTLSPYQRAVMQAPELEPQEDARFEKRNDLKVYSAPGENTWRASGATVTTDDNVLIFGTENGYVLVDYPIGNGSRGRIGYIDDKTLDEPEMVKQLQFCSIPVPLFKDVQGTDDPLHGQAPITTFQKGEEVTLLAFMGEDWAYVQTGLEGRVCRLFIPRDALLED